LITYDATMFIYIYIYTLLYKTGRRFLAGAFALHQSFPQQLHTTVKEQLPRARKPVLTAYAGVYFKAWRAAPEGGVLQTEIETSCIQDLMQCCVHAATAALFNNVLALLDAFHEQKRQRGVDAMLLRLYDPILWRSLKTANPGVRMQACTVLAHAFPLHDPGKLLLLLCNVYMLYIVRYTTSSKLWRLCNDLSVV
jgi:condensin-2 complex subunit G2